MQRANHFIVRLDGRGYWYRYHQLFGELLRVELDRRGAPVADLHRRAAAWLIDNDYAADAIRHLSLAGDTAGAAELVVDHWTDFLQGGDLTSINNALDDVGEDAVRRDPRLCLIRAWMTINLGRIAELGGWIDAAEYAAARWPGRDSAALTAAAAMLRCIAEYLSGDARAAIAIARQAIALDAEERPPWRSVGCPVLGIALYWSGDTDESCATLNGALPRAEQAGNHLAAMHALGCLALAATDRGDELGALRIADQAMAVRDAHGFAEHWASAMAHLARARALSARGDVVLAEQAVARAVQLSRHGLARIELAFGLLTWAELRLRQHDRQQAIDLMNEADATLRACSDPGLVQDLARELARHAGRRAGPTACRRNGSGAQ